jgi:hypothetical protein
MHRTSPVRPVVPHYFVSPQRARLARLLPAAVTLLGALLPACTPDPTIDEIVSEGGYSSNRFLRAIAKPDAIEEEAPPEDFENSGTRPRAPVSGTRARRARWAGPPRRASRASTR